MLMVERYAGWLIRWRWVAVVLTLLWVFAAASGARFLNFTNDYRVFFSADNPQLVAFDVLQNSYSKSDNLLFVVTPKEGNVFTQEILAIVEELTEAAWQIPYSSRVDSITNFQNTYGRDDDLVVEPLVKHALSLSPADIARLPYGLDLNNQINVDKSATRFDVTVRSLSTNALLALEERAQQWLRHNAPESMWTDGSSPPIMFAHIGQRNIQSMLKGSVVALILISMTMIVSLRSLRVGMISLVPNLVPAAMAFGIWGIFVGQVGLSLSVVVGMTLGVIVDDTVHFLSKYLRARREKGLSSEDAVRYAFSTVGMAMWVTSVALVAGFLMLSLSAFELNSGMGLLTAITIVLALLADLLLLPALLLKFEESRNERNIATDA